MPRWRSSNLVLALAIGQSSPPVGVSLFVACSVARARIGQVALPLLPFLLALFAALLIVTFWPDPATPAIQVRRVLQRRHPDRIVYAPNYWQWFAHHRNHGLLPPEIAHCRTQLDLIRHLGLDVFSRNVYCDQSQCWFGGLAAEVWDGIEVCENVHLEGRDRVITRTYHTRGGTLTERQRHVFADSTLVQEKFVLDGVEDPLAALEELVNARRWKFSADHYALNRNRSATTGLWSPASCSARSRRCICWRARSKPLI